MKRIWKISKAESGRSQECHSECNCCGFEEEGSELTDVATAACGRGCGCSKVVGVTGFRVFGSAIFDAQIRTLDFQLE
jgi:hypothetical protein